MLLSIFAWTIIATALAELLVGVVIVPKLVPHFVARWATPLFLLFCLSSLLVGFSVLYGYPILGLTTLHVSMVFIVLRFIGLWAFILRYSIYCIRRKKKGLPDGKC